MGFGLVYDGPPTKCAKGPRPGTKALRDGVMALFPGVTDVGIFNCRPTRNKGSKTLSFHADGRAWDAGCSGALNDEVFRFLIAHADELGIQEAISQRRRWDSRTGKVVHYGGDDPHTEHVHTSQCLRAANSLTKATVLAAGRPDQEDDMPLSDDDVEKVAKRTAQYLAEDLTLDRATNAAVGRIEQAILDPSKGISARLDRAIDDLDDSKPGGLTKGDVKAALAEVLSSVKG